ncbi:glycoside hydrolase family 13 protein [Amniculicola lignicola CBS 123094]|uniref:alpha-amylase n=1 Tax=Amniculicola lignicola CBS 123094 TaxID=1392246 RepID=A0A6A5X5J3_9PLEO|nr:glycoside hydrolase family 13 protein [Amniculicola lignicola CBS 123094]
MIGWGVRVVIVALAVAGAVNGASKEEWRGRSIYQLLTDRFALTDGSTTAKCNTADGVYCGGTWRGIIGQLDYIQQMGFTAIWISPIVYNIPEKTPYGYAYHGFWQQDLYRLNDHFGTADDLKALSKALHNRDMYLMVDVVANHNGWNGSASTVDYSAYNPFNKREYFHNFCDITDWSNQTSVEDCWLGDARVELTDLRTEDPIVAAMYSKWIHKLVSNYSIDGLRIDTVKHVGKPFWALFQAAAGVFGTGEVLSGDAKYTCDYQNYLDSVLDYPSYWPLMRFINSTSGSNEELLSTMSSMRTDCKDVTLLGSFSENHDLPRFASQTQDLALAKNAIAFTLLNDGIPILYAGQEQHYDGYGDPGNREATWLARYSREGELYKVVQAVNQVRNWAINADERYLTYNIFPIYNDTHTVAFRKGYDGQQILSVITNTGTENPLWTLNLTNHGLSTGSSVVEVMTCAKLTVDETGTLAVPMQGGMPRIYFPVDATDGSGICGASTKSNMASGTGNAQPSATKEGKGGLGRKSLERGRRVRKKAVAAAGLAVAAAAVGGGM